MSRHFLVVFTLIALAIASLNAYASKRIALVVGNDTYQNISVLKNARSDARAVAAALRGAGFDVTLKTDVSEKAFLQTLRSFKAQVNGGDEAVFYFSGHGVQIGSANYLLPVDIASDNEEQVKDDAVPLQRVLDDLQDQKARFSLAIVDACRDNPFKGRGRNIGGRGLQPINPASGQMVLYSAGAGQQALDRLSEQDRDPNGLFTRILLKEIDRPGISVDRVLRNVRDQVVRLAKSVNHDQVPALYDQTIGEFYFKRGRPEPDGPRPAPPVNPVPTPRPAPAPVVDSDPGETAYWADVKKSDDLDYYTAYLASYPNGRYVADANEYIERDKQAKAAREKLKEDQAWQQAQRADSREAYAAYLKAYPGGRYAPLAKLKHDKLKPSVLEPEMVRIPGKNYEMGKYEVTQAQWRSVMGNNPSRFQGCDDCPVEQVSWNDIQDYLSKLNQMTGQQYRLPTAAEWKHACDGGREQEYCGSGNLDAVGWYDKNSGNKTHPVGQKQANGYGLYDMSGNVWEWQQDCWEGDCSVRVLRGGSWYGFPLLARAANRNWDTPSLRVVNGGFRVVRAARTF